MRCLCTLGVALCLTTWAEAAGEPPSSSAERIVVMVRVGKLSEAEISPSPQLKVPALWRLALEGVSLTRLERRGEGGAGDSLDDLKRALLPANAAAEAVNWRSSRPVQAAVSPAQRALADRFGAPPPPGVEERAGIDAFRAALGSPRLFGDGAPADGVSSEDLGWLARSAITLVRVPAAAGSAADAAERDSLLERVIAGAGPASNVIVVNLPERGAGTLIARGPRLKRARVSERPRTLAATRGLVAALLDPTAGEKDPTIEEELVHELFQ